MVRIAGLAAAAVGVVMAMGQSAGHAERLRGPDAATFAAAGSQTFTDPTGDNQAGAPDITTVQFSNDDSGRLEVRVTVANRSDLIDKDFINVVLDSDQNMATGCFPGELGIEYTLGVLGHTAPTLDTFDVLRCLKDKSDRFTPQRTLTGEFDVATSTAVWHFGCAEIGRPRSLRLVVIASHGDPQNDPNGVVSDVAGLEPWLYEVLPPCGPDITPPRVAAVPSVGVRGATARLVYRVQDDSGYAKETFAIFRGKRRLAHTSSVAFANADATKTYFVTWPVPKKLARKLRFCVSAVDEAKNRSRTSCASLTIR